MNKKGLNARLALVMFLILCPVSHALAVIEFQDGFNFRRVSENIPVNQEQIRDALVIGTNIIDTDTGRAPADAFVNARNEATGEVVPLTNGSTGSYFAILPYSASTAAGAWVVEVRSSDGIATDRLNAFTGPGTGPIPPVENISVTRGTNTVVSWSLPPNLDTANDGNISRFRIRLRNPDRDSVLDERLDGDITSTSYTLPESLFTKNGLYEVAVLLEGTAPFNRSENFAWIVVNDVDTGGQPVFFDNAELVRDHRSSNSVGRAPGDRIGVFSSVNAENDFNNTNETVTVFAQIGARAFAIRRALEPELYFDYGSTVPYNTSLAAPWTITALDGAFSDALVTPSLSGTPRLPFVTNIRLKPDFLQPTLRWDLPAGFIATSDNISIGLFDDETDFRISIGENGELFAVPDTPTSFRIPEGFLEYGRNYVARIVLRTRNIDGQTISRSITFLNFTPIMSDSPGDVFLPTVDARGVFNFDFDVTAAVPIQIDPIVAVGYDYAIGEGNPRFSTVNLPAVGDSEFTLSVYADDGSVLGVDTVPAGVTIDLNAYLTGGVKRFRVEGIETTAALDPSDPLAFVTTVSFATSGRFTGTMTPLAVEVDDARSYPRVLATPDRAGTGQYGWVLFEDQTKQWIDVDCRGTLSDLPLDVLEWDEIREFADRTPIACSDIRPASDRPFRLVTTPDREESPDYGWVIYPDGSKQWIDASCRLALTDAGHSLELKPWSEISIYPDGQVRTCDQLLENNRPTIAEVLVTPDRETSGNYGWVKFSDDTKQWVDGFCRDQLEGDGISVRALEWIDISSYADSDSYYECDALRNF